MLAVRVPVPASSTSSILASASSSSVRCSMRTSPMAIPYSFSARCTSDPRSLRSTAPEPSRDSIALATRAAPSPSVSDALALDMLLSREVSATTSIRAARQSCTDSAVLSPSRTWHPCAPRAAENSIWLSAIVATSAGTARQARSQVVLPPPPIARSALASRPASDGRALCRAAPGRCATHFPSRVDRCGSLRSRRRQRSAPAADRTAHRVRAWCRCAGRCRRRRSARV